ncbi:hypothetical protein [Bradyrhizobium sp.]|uniref:hypothetical protein n=1 Tax=Bradyrhizobium sp. TaxID=376 RepID=UPI0025C4336D|nr:hypothetical protein [Bradyrhizobium sp.]
MLEMTQAEYARHRGVTKQAVGKLVKSGKIALSVNAEGRRVIDAAAADRALGEVRERVIVRDEPEAGAPHRGAYLPPGDGAGLTKAKIATEVYRARLSQLEYEERVGRLLRTEDVTRSMELCAEMIVRDIDRLPTRADDIAAAFTKGGVPAVRAALKDIARQTRETLEQNMRILSDGEVGAGSEDAVS